MSNANHIAFVCPRFAEGGTVGGAETLLKALAEHAAAAGRQVTFLTTCARNHFTWENELPPGVRRIGDLDVHYFPVDEDRNIGAFLRIQTTISNGVPVSREDEETWQANSVNSGPLYKHLREHGNEYDRIVMGPYLFGVVYAASQVLPEKTFLVPCLHDEPFATLTITRDLFDRVAGIMFNTAPEQDLARSLFAVDDAKCSIVGMGMEPFEADASAFASRRGIDHPYVIYSGRREPLKGTPLLVDYMHTFRERTGRDIKLVFTGSGPIDAPVEMEEHVLDVGFVSEGEKREAMAGAVAFCHPSTHESLGIVLLESWLARTPGLVHSGSEVLKDQCRRSGGGLWFRLYAEFEEELSLLLENEDLRTSMAEAGRKYVLDEYAWENVEDKLFEALDRELE